MPTTRQKCSKTNNTKNINDILSDDTNHEKNVKQLLDSTVFLCRHGISFEKQKQRV